MSKKLVAMAMAIAFHATGSAAETVTARVGVIPVIGAAPLFIAEKEGWLRAGGLELQTKLFESGPNIVQAAASGGIDIYIGGVAPAAAGRAKGIDLRVVAALAVDENVLVGGAKLKAFFKKGVAPAAAFKAFRAANGRPARIATQPPGSVPAANLQYWLREATHTDPSDIEIVSIGIDATQQALLAGAVEAATVREPTLTIVQKANPEIALIAGGGGAFSGSAGHCGGGLEGFSRAAPAAGSSVGRRPRPRRGGTAEKPRPGGATYRSGAVQGHRRRRDHSKIAVVARRPFRRRSERDHRIDQGPARLSGHARRGRQGAERRWPLRFELLRQDEEREILEEVSRRAQRRDEDDGDEGIIDFVSRSSAPSPSRYPKNS
ncbi:hypothetical protein Ms3S1_p10160 (plasmid) [Methylosinus sp. 3S-1]